MKRTINEFFNLDVLNTNLKKTRNDYRPYDAGWYLYREILRTEFKDKFCQEFCELLYATLSAWNMNSRGAKFFSKFKNSIVTNEIALENLKGINLSEINTTPTRSNLLFLYDNLDLVAETKPKLVTFAKTLHFLLPDLVCPIDRTYTLNYFYNNTNVPSNGENQFNRFWAIENEFSRFALHVDLVKFINDDNGDFNIPKIIDNAIIGYCKLNIKP